MDNDRSNVTVSGTAALYNHDTQQYVEASQNPICVEWTISEQEDLQNATSSGKAYTSSDIDYTIKVEASGIYVSHLSQVVSSLYHRLESIHLVLLSIQRMR